MLGLKDILTEGRVEDAQKYFEKAVGDWPVAEPNNQAGIGVGTNLDGVLKHFTQNDPSGNNKYLMWMIKMYVNPEERGTSPNDISSLVQRFHKNVDRLSPVLMMGLGFANPRLVTSPKNLDSYEDIAQLERVMDEVESIQTRKEKETEAKEGVDKLYEDERWLLVKPNTYEGSCYYGSSTKWCTASTDYPKHFKDYTSTGNLFYIIDKSQDLGDFYKIALYKKFKDGSEEWYDRADNKLNDHTENAIYSMLPKGLVSAFVDAHEKYEKPKPGLKDLEAFKVELENYVSANKKLQTINTESGTWRLYINDGVWHWYSTPDPSSQEQFIHEVQATPFWQGRNEIPFDFVNVDDATGGWHTTAGPESMENEYITQSLYLDRDPEPNRHEDYGVRVFLSQIYFPLLVNELSNEFFQNIVGTYTTWQPESYVSSYKFNYPPREGTMTRKFVDYLKQNVGYGLGDSKGKTANQFYEDVLGYSRPRAHNAMFFASIKDSGIVKMERQGRQFVYSLGPNYQDWVEGRLLRT